MKTLAEAWASYAASVLPSTAPLVQRVETRRGFYAGAQALLGVQVSNLSDGPECTDADDLSMDRLRAELDAFCAAIGTPAELAACRVHRAARKGAN